MQNVVRAVLPTERRGAAGNSDRVPAFAFAAINAAQLPPARGVKLVTEPATGLQLEAEHCSSNFSCAQLCAAGVRSKRIAGLASVQVYALGIYIDTQGAKKALASTFKKAGGKSKPEDVAEACVSLANVERTLQLVFARSLDGATVAGALAERLESQLPPSSPALTAFKSAFTGVKLVRGSVVTLSCKNGNLTVKVGNKHAPHIVSPALCYALFETYLGPNPVVPDAKVAFGTALAAQLANN